VTKSWISFSKRNKSYNPKLEVVARAKRRLDIRRYCTR